VFELDEYEEERNYIKMKNLLR